MHRTFGLLGLAGLAAVVWAASAAPSNAAAPVYPWCARYGGGDYGGAENCGFWTVEQCRATVSGIGGHCQMNVYWPPANPEPRHQPRRKHAPPPR